MLVLGYWAWPLVGSPGTWLVPNRGSRAFVDKFAGHFQDIGPKAWAWCSTKAHPGEDYD
jgi:hypothetical protein